MRKNRLTLIAGIAFLAAVHAVADNPIVQTIFTADPAPFVYRDTVYLYTGHDEDNSKYFTMNDWHVFSTKDMVNWTDLGSPLSIQNFSWAKSDAWAGQAIERDGKFYWYVPINQKTGDMAIGVAVGDTPTGPFKDALGKPLVHDGFGDIDPTVFIDKDGQAYLGWGNPVYKHVLLNKDMTSFNTQVGDQGIFRSPMTVAEFGPRDDTKRPTSYEEGPWLYERNGIYYNIFAAGPIPEHLAYSTATSPAGPWKYGGVIMDAHQPGAAFTNHPGVIDYKGKTFLFYHNGRLPGGGGFDRSVAIEELKFSPDGSLKQVAMTNDGPPPVAALNPYQRVEAETMAWEHGIKVVPGEGQSLAITPTRDGAFIRVRHVDFSSRRSRNLQLSFENKGKETALETHLDHADGPLLAMLKLPHKETDWHAASASTAATTGIHDLYFTFPHGSTLDDAPRIDWWKLTH